MVINDNASTKAIIVKKISQMLKLANFFLKNLLFSENNSIKN